MEIEHITRISFTAGGALEDQGHLAVSHGLLGKVIKHDEHIVALIHEPLTDGAASVGGQVLVDRRIRSGSTDDGGVLHRASVFERLHHTGDVGLLLADGDVDAVKGLVALELALGGSLVLLRLGNDGVHCDGGLAGGAVTNDQFTLAATNRDHGVDGHNAGLHRHRDRLTCDDARSELFNGVTGFHPSRHPCHRSAGRGRSPRGPAGCGRLARKADGRWCGLRRQP